MHRTISAIGIIGFHNTVSRIKNGITNFCILFLLKG